MYFLLQREALVTTSLDFDEILTWNIALSSWGDLFRSLWGDTQQVLYYGLLKLYAWVIPANTDYWIRLPSVLLGGMAAWLAISHARRLYSPVVVLLFLAYLLSAPLPAFFSTYLRPYALFLALGLVHLDSLRRLYFTQETTPKARALTYWSAVALLLTQHLAWPLLLGEATSLVLLGKDPREFLWVARKRLAWVIPLACALLLIHQFRFRANILWAFSRPVSLYQCLASALGPAFLLLAAIGARPLWLQRRQFPFESFLLVNLALPLMGLVVASVHVDRYYILLMPSAFFLLPWLIHWLLELAGFRQNLVMLVMLAILLGGDWKSGTFRLTPIPAGRTVGVKAFVREARSKGWISETARVACVLDGLSYASPVFKRYSEMHWDHDICGAYFADASRVDLNEWGQVIVIRSEPDHALDGVPGWNALIAKGLVLEHESPHVLLFRVLRKSSGAANISGR